MKVGTFIGGWLGHAAEEARQAEAIGHDYVACDESHHDSMLTMAIAAANTSKVELQTAVTVAFPRSPMILAMEAWDIQQLSRGRFGLGLGTQWPDHSEQRFSVSWAAPVPRMREYVQCLRAVWDTFQHGTAPGFLGKHYRFQLMTPAYNPGPIDYPRPKIYIGAGRPAMSRLAGELADGIPHVRVTDKYMRHIILPNVKAGLERSGRTWDEIEITASGALVLGDDESEIEQGLSRVRRLIARAFLPGSHLIGPRDEIFALHGWDDLGERLHALAREGKLQEMEQVIPEDVVRSFAQTSTYDGLPKFLGEHREYARRTFFSMPVRNEAEQERFRHLLREIQKVDTPGIPAGFEQL